MMIAFAVSGILAVALVVSVVLGARAAARVTRIEASLAKSESSLRRFAAELHLSMQAQQKLAAGIEALTETREAAPLQQAAPRGYDQAIRMARTGAPAVQLVTSCGMTRSEADLLVALHGPQAA